MARIKTKNKFEARVETELRRAKAKYKYEQEKIPYVLARHYIPDFIIETPNGRIYVECKGYLRPEHKSKMVAVKRQHPSKDIRILFYARKLKDEKWAIKNGFKFAYSSIPKEWLEGL